MSQPASPNSPVRTELTDADLDALMAHPSWEPLGDEMDRLMAFLPRSTELCERTTVLTWIYQQQGVMSFVDLSRRITGGRDATIRKRHVRATVRGLEKLLLVCVDNFEPDPGVKVAPTPDGAIGETTLLTLTWGGMIWLRRAWQARARLAGVGSIEVAHRTLVEEEDDGKANEPFWVENMTSLHPDGPLERARGIATAMPSLTSVFGLAQHAGKEFFKNPE